MKIVYTGGGTGGHFYPLIAVSEQINKLVYKDKLVFPVEYYFSSKNIDENMLRSRNIKYSWIPSGKKRLYFSLLNYLDIFKLMLGTCIAFFKLLFLYPDVIFSKGGFDSLPTCFAAFLLRIPIVMHDSDSIPGRASLLISKFAYRIAVSYEESIKYYPDRNKVAFVGQPILEKYIPKAELNRTGDENIKKNILIIGGSSGSVRINDSILQILPQLIAKYNIIHQVGNSNIEDIKLRSKVILDSYNSDSYAPYGSIDFSKIYPSIDLAITRAGSTLFELAAWQIPAIVIPIPESISRDQSSNADVFYKKGAVKIINENNLTPNILFNLIQNILEDKNTYQSMVDACKKINLKNGGETIAAEIIKICQSHR
jgi:UDP-N-acetylglucosamine--N-acetylmuramyl-(pentapeptide) pyrophosphoryl-undecaprenol N-acetylglucosamine transferase